MTRINNLLKNFSIATGLLGALYISSPKISLADGITENQCLTNYQLYKNNPDCQEVYKKYFVIGTQGPVINTPGGCENKLDDDGDTFIDNVQNKADPDCFINNIYNPSNTETNIDSEPYIPVISKKQCSNGKDDDNDRCADERDNDCYTNGKYNPENPENNPNSGCRPIPPPTPKKCNDGIDNDGDGLIDLSDPGCSSATDDDETDPIVMPQCSDGVDNDGDGCMDKGDNDCYTNEKYNPENPENNPNSGCRPIFELSDLEIGLEGLLTNFSSTETRVNSEEVNLDGNGQIYGGYTRFPIGNKNLVVLLGEYGNLNLDVSNEFGKFGEREIEFYKLGFILQSQLLNGKLRLEPGVVYTNQDTKKTNNIINIEDKEAMKITHLSLKAMFDLLKKDNAKLALVVDLNRSFINYTDDEGTNENPSTGEYGGGLDLSTKTFNAQGGVRYKQVYNLQSFEAGDSNTGDDILDSTNLYLATRLGFNNLYGIAAVQIPVSANGIEEKLYGFGAGFNKIGKLPLGLRAIYINKNTKIDTEPTQTTDTQEDIYGLCLIWNGRNDNLNSYMNPFIAHNQN